METLNNFILLDPILEAALSQNEFVDFVLSRIEFVNSEIYGQANSASVVKYGQKAYQVDISLSLLCLTLTSASSASDKIRDNIRSQAKPRELQKKIKTWKDAQFASKIEAKLAFLIEQCN